jgi:MoaA/NifB/PqqE/SkfB family radical SAM enzyme
VKADAVARVLRGLRAGVPEGGPLEVHLDVTNTCNAACVTCWDHSPDLREPRPNAWKARKLDADRFRRLVDELAALGSVEHVVVSGMGEPFTHPRIYEMLAHVRARGMRITLMTNLVAADIDRLLSIGVDHLLVGVQGVTPATHAAFHPGWTEAQFFRLCQHLRALGRAGSRVRHVHVIERHTAEEVVEMVRFGHRFGADRVNFKLASLAGGTEVNRITAAQRARLLSEDVPAAQALAARLGVPTNLDLFTRQLEAGLEGEVQTTPMRDVGCYMGHVYTRVTVDGDVLYCCNTNVRVAHVDDAPFRDLWFGDAWQGLRDRLRERRFFEGCERCGKFEQNVAWAKRVAGDRAEIPADEGDG